MAETKPLFEVITDHHHYRIYEDGHIEGFPSDGKCLVFNRIPQLVNKVAKDTLDVRRQMRDAAVMAGDMPYPWER